MSHVWRIAVYAMRHVIFVDDSSLTHVTGLTSCHTDECVMSHMRMYHIKHMIASCHTYECVMSQMSGWRHTHEWVILGHDTFEFVTSHMWIRHVIHVSRVQAGRYGQVCCSVLRCVAVCRSVSHMQHEYIWMRTATHMNPSCHTNRLGDKDKNYVVKVLWTVGECCLDVILSPFFSFSFFSSSFFLKAYRRVHSRRRIDLWDIWISRCYGFTVNSFEWRGLRLVTWNRVWNLGNSRENVFDMYGLW